MPQDSKPAQSVTFNRDIAPIIFRSCSTCHRPGEAAPFSLLTYSDVKKHARQIAEVTRLRVMPPWLPEPQKLKFADELRLSQSGNRSHRAMGRAGGRRGRASDLPPQPKFVEGWRLGKPDLILTATKPLTLPPQGTDTYWNFIFPVPIQETTLGEGGRDPPGRQAIRASREHSGGSRRSIAQPRKRAGRGFRRHGDSYRVAGIRSRQPSSLLEAGDGSIR